MPAAKPTPAPLPAYIYLGPFRYTVTTDERQRLRAQEQESEVRLLGHTDHDATLIILDDRPAPGTLRETLFHELLHVVAEVSGLSYTWGKETEEGTIRRLSPIILELIRRNPTAVAYLLELDR